MTAYATLADLYAVMPLTMMGSVSVGTQQSILDKWNAHADSKFRSRYKLPMVAPYDVAIVNNICLIAAWQVARVRGYNPAAGADPVIQEMAEMALKWFDDVERQRAHPDVIETTGDTPYYPAPRVISKALQGWYPGTGSSES